jgi:hypothetical protein
MEEIKTVIKKYLGDVNFVGIVYAKDWFAVLLQPQIVRPDDFIVCRWSDFHDGQKSNYEGMETIAICRKLEHAELIYNSL